MDSRPKFLGVPTLKNPLDLWIFQEILWEKQPDLILEAGTGHGGSALYLATILDAIGAGRVVTVDWRDRGQPPHPRITYLGGRSTDPEVLAAMTPKEEKTMVVLDSGHRMDHVLEELHAYSPFVSPRQYLIVEDTNLNGNPIRPDYGPGPMEAVEQFLSETGDFEPDRSREKFDVTTNPRGYLLRS
jgi:cephalosporin hydroxylase